MRLRACGHLLPARVEEACEIVTRACWRKNEFAAAREKTIMESVGAFAVSIRTTLRR